MASIGTTNILDNLKELCETDSTFAESFEVALRVVEHTLDLFSPAGTVLSFNGCKNACVCFVLLLAVLQQEGRGGVSALKDVTIACFSRHRVLPEVDDFMCRLSEAYGFQFTVLEGQEKEGLQMLKRNGAKAIIVGVRLSSSGRGDSYGSRGAGVPDPPDQHHFEPTLPGWPVAMRINPMLHFSYADVWKLLRGCGLSNVYCPLYDQGYTCLELGAIPHPALRKEDGSYLPARCLVDTRLERAHLMPYDTLERYLLSPGLQGTPRMRGNSPLADVRDEHSSGGSCGGGIGVTRDKDGTVAIVVIGDEILSGRVSDENSNFMCRRLKKMGGRVSKVIVVPDDVKTIVMTLRELVQKYEHVITSGGVGPTHDDVTMEAVAIALEAPLQQHAEMRRVLAAFVEGGEAAVAQNNAYLKLSLLPQGAELIYGPCCTGNNSSNNSGSSGSNGSDTSGSSSCISKCNSEGWSSGTDGDCRSNSRNVNNDSSSGGAGTECSKCQRKRLSMGSSNSSDNNAIGSDHGTHATHKSAGSRSKNEFSRNSNTKVSSGSINGRCVSSSGSESRIRSTAATLSVVSAPPPPPSSSSEAPRPPSTYPVVRVKNVFVLPGVPEFCRGQFSQIEHLLTSSSCQPPFFTSLRVLREEVDIASLLTELAKQFPEVAVGSYPQSRQTNAITDSTSTGIKSNGSNNRSHKSSGGGTGGGGGGQGSSRSATDDMTYKVLVTLESKHEHVLTAALQQLIERLTRLEVLLERERDEHNGGIRSEPLVRPITIRSNL